MPEKTKTYYIIQSLEGQEFIKSCYPPIWTGNIKEARWYFWGELAAKEASEIPGSVVRTLTLTVT